MFKSLINSVITYYEKRNMFECPTCSCTFELISFWFWLSRPHFLDKWRYLKCPLCGKRHWMRYLKKDLD